MFVTIKVDNMAANGLQPGVSGDASELRTIGKIKIFS